MASDGDMGSGRPKAFRPSSAAGQFAGVFFGAGEQQDALAVEVVG